MIRDYAVTTYEALAAEIRAVLNLAREPRADLGQLERRLLRDVGEVKAAEYEEHARPPYRNRSQRIEDAKAQRGEEAAS